MFTLTHLAIMNDFLMEYEKRIYPMIDVFLHLSPQQLDQVYQWRLQQEHHMQQTRHVKGLTDDQVRQFVDTYMPAYELYLPQLNEYGFFGFQQQQQQDSEKFDNAKKNISRRQPYCFEGLIRQDGGYSCNQIARHLRLVLDKDRKVLSAQFIHPCLSLTSSSSSFDHQKVNSYSPSFYNNNNKNKNSHWLRRSTLLLTTFTLGWLIYQRHDTWLNNIMRYSNRYKRQ